MGYSAILQEESLEAMKKTKLTRSLLAACSIVALSAVMYGCVHNGGDDEPVAEAPEPMPEPMPEPDPGPTDLDDTQAAAAAAETAAMTASTNAAASAKSATDDTMYLATLQTGDDLNSKKMGGNEHAKAASDAAKEAADAYAEAKAAAAAAAAATTGEAGEAAWRMAVDAQADAEAAEAMAATHAEAASEAAMSELHIKGMLKWVGGLAADDEGASSINAAMGKLTTPAAVTTDPDIVTGLQDDVMRENSGAHGGRAHTAPEVTPVLPYIQAVEGRDLAIGKTLDTTDDKARLTVIHSRAGAKKVGVYVLGDDAGNFAIQTDSDGDKERGTVTGGTFSVATAANILADGTGLKSEGTFYEASNTTVVAGNRTTDDDTGGADGTATFPGLDHDDLVEAETKGKAIFSYVDVEPGPDGNLDTADDLRTTRYVVETSKIVDAATGNTAVTYRHVDTMAPAAPDTAADINELLDLRSVKVNLPTATKYEHIHFGVWAGLGEPAASGAQKLTGLGIGFVQNFSGSGMTARLGIGTVTYNGDWVAVIQRQNSAGAGAYSMDDGAATLVANFDKKEFTGTLAGLATLSGDLSGNGFSGMKATNISHGNLDSNGTFKGSFSGNIYGAAGEEAAGVFDFSGDDAGSFRGAFGGTNQE